jgi:pimeloyl-ACP methyl ester carboxylesterase
MSVDVANRYRWQIRTKAFGSSIDERAMIRLTSRLLLRYLAVALLGVIPSTCQAAPPELLRPTGPLSIGRTSYHWIGPARDRTVAGTKRELMAHVWYPAISQPSAPRAAYIPEFRAIEAAVGAENLKKEAGASYEALASAQTHAVTDAEVIPHSGKYPVLVLLHGLRFNALGYSMLAEDLASHGYVVVGLDLPAIAYAVAFPDQRVTRFSEATWTQSRSPEETIAFESQVVDQCGRDAVFAVDQLARLESGELPSQFQRRLDLARLGVVGHSFGGRNAARACQLDKRLKAGVLLDSFGRTMTVEKRPDGSTMDQPMMIQYVRRVPRQGISRIFALLQTLGKDLEAELRRARQEFCQSVKAVSYEVTLDTPGIAHESFSDILLLESGQSAETKKNRTRAMQLTRDYTRAFFDRHLRDLPATLLDRAPVDPNEVELIRHTFRDQ